MFDSVIANFVLALVTVLVLIGVLSYFGKRFGLITGATRRRVDGKRLGIIEVANVDAKRRLLLVRRDETEHLILLGLNADLLVEGGIPIGEVPARAPKPPKEEPGEDLPWMKT